MSPLDRLMRPVKKHHSFEPRTQSASKNRKALQVHAVDYDPPEKSKSRWSKNLRKSLKNGGSTMYRMHQQRKKARETQRSIDTARSVTQQNELESTSPTSSSWEVTTAASNLPSTLPSSQSSATMTFARLVEIQKGTSSPLEGSTRVLMSAASGDDNGESWGRSFAERDGKVGRRSSLSKASLSAPPRKGNEQESASEPSIEEIQPKSRSKDEDKKSLPAPQHEHEKVTSSQNATLESQKERAADESPRKSPPSTPTKSKRSPRRKRKGVRSSPTKDTSPGTLQTSLSDITLDSPPQWGDFGALNSPERHEVMFSTLSVDRSDNATDGGEKIAPKSLFETIPHSPDLREAPGQMMTKHSPVSTEELRIWSLPRYQSTVAATTRAGFQAGQTSAGRTVGKEPKAKSPKSKKKKEQSEKKVDSLQWGDYGQLSSPDRKTTLDRLVDPNIQLDPIPRFDPEDDDVLIKSNRVSWNKMMNFAAGLDDQNNKQGVPWLRELSNGEVDSDEGSTATEDSRKALTDKLDGIVSRKEGSFMNQFNEKLQNFNHSDSFQDLKNFWEKSVNDATSPPSYKKPANEEVSSESSKTSLPTSDSGSIHGCRRRLSKGKKSRKVKGNKAVAHRERNKEDATQNPPVGSISSLDGSIGDDNDAVAHRERNKEDVTPDPTGEYALPLDGSTGAVQSKDTPDMTLSSNKEEEKVAGDEILPPKDPTETLSVKNEISHKDMAPSVVADEPAENVATTTFALKTQETPTEKVRDADVQNSNPTFDAVENKTESSPTQVIQKWLTEKEEAPMPTKENRPEDECKCDIARSEDKCTNGIGRPDPPTFSNDGQESKTNANRRRIYFADEKGLPMEHIIEVGGKDDPYSSGRIVVLLLNPALKKFEFLHAEHLLREEATVQDLLKQLPTFSATQVFQDSKYCQLYTTKHERRMLDCDALLVDCDIDPTDVLVAVPTNTPPRDHIDCATPLLGSANVMAAVRHARRTGRGLKQIQSTSDRKPKSKKNAESSLTEARLSVPQLDVKDDIPEIPVLHSEREESRKLMRALQTGLVAAVGIFYTVNSQ